LEALPLEPQDPGLVKLFSGILYSDKDLLRVTLRILQEMYGDMDFQSQPFGFDITDYYASEMGIPIERMFVAFDRLIHPRDIARIKVETNEIEDRLSVQGNRKINLDPGYMDYDKMVLASAKYNGQKIYLDHGIWADLTLHYEKGKFVPYPWSFPDFEKGIYDEIFLEIRQKFKGQRKG